MDGTNGTRVKRLGRHGDSCFVWKLYAPGVSQETIEADFQEFEGRDIYSVYDCTGKWFAWPARVRRTQTRTLVKQYWGKDI